MPNGALSRFLSNALVLASGIVIGQSITLLTSPIVSRLYTPDDFGRYGLLIAFIGFVTVVSSLRYETAIVATDSLTDAAYLVIASLSASTVVSALSSICLYVLIKLRLLGFGELPLWSPLLAFLMCVTTSGFFVLRYWLIRIDKFKCIRQVTIYQNSVRSIIHIGLGYVHFSTPGLLWGECLGRLSGIGRIIRDSHPILRKQLESFQYSKMRAILEKYREFPTYSLPSALLDSLSAALLLPLVVELYGAQEAGYLALVQRVIAIPALLIGGTIADSFHHHMANDARTRVKQVTPFFFRVTLILTLFSLLLAGFLIFFAQPVFVLVFGDSWAMAGSIAVKMAPLFAVGLIVSPLSRVVLVFKGQKYKLIYDLLGIAIVLGTLYGGKYLGASFLISISCYSYLGVLAYVVYFLVLLYIITSHEKEMQNKESEQLAQII